MINLEKIKQDKCLPPFKQSCPGTILSPLRSSLKPVSVFISQCLKFYSLSFPTNSICFQVLLITCFPVSTLSKTCAFPLHCHLQHHFTTNFLCLTGFFVHSQALKRSHIQIHIHQTTSSSTWKCQFRFHFIFLVVSDKYGLIKKIRIVKVCRRAIFKSNFRLLLKKWLEVKMKMYMAQQPFFSNVARCMSAILKKVTIFSHCRGQIF